MIGINENGMNETMEMKNRYKKQLQDLNLSDNFLFAFAMSDEGVCKEFLEKLLGIDIEELEIVQSELTHEVSYDAKAVRFDIYARDKAGKVYEIEMQNVNEGNIPKRSRYYGSIIDTKELSKGSEYDELPQSYIIFICTFDPFGDGRHIYTFENICRENTKILLKDDTQKVILNTRGRIDDVSTEIKDFLKYIEKSTPEMAETSTGSLTRHMHRIVKKVKSGKVVPLMNLQEILDSAKSQSYNEGMEAGLSQGLLQGAAQEKLKNAKSMKTAGVGFSIINMVTGLSMEEIKKL